MIFVLNQPPVRLCCFQRHRGSTCPDGLVMCCLCFNRFPVSELNVVDGLPEDVCRKCAEEEQLAKKTTVIVRIPSN